MLLVCGAAGVTSEGQKKLRRDVGLMDFSCKVGTKGDSFFKGLLCFEGQNVSQEHWCNLLNYLEKEKGVIPFYFVLEDGKRFISYEYGKKSLESGTGVFSPVFSILRGVLGLSNKVLGGIILSKK